MFVKVCGIKNFEEIDWACELGYSAIGIVVYPESKRFVNFKKAVKLFEYAKGNIVTVAVSLYFNDVKKFKKYADFLQCYEKVKVENLIFATDTEPDFNDFQFILYDASKGRGDFKNFPQWIKKYRENLIIAGGLTPKNIKKIIDEFKPSGVDVSSGVEINGKKNYNLMKEFIEQINFKIFHKLTDKGVL